MLECLRAAPEKQGITPLWPSFMADIHWILSYLPAYNGIQMIPFSPTLITPVVVDSCLTGCGGHFGHLVYHSEYPEFFITQNLTICDLKILNILITIKLWAPQLGGHIFRVQCDNAAAISVLCTGKGWASFPLSCASEIWQYTPQYKFEIRPEHLPGADNDLADKLSRCHLSVSSLAQVQNLCETNGFTMSCWSVYV